MNGNEPPTSPVNVGVFTSRSVAKETREASESGPGFESFESSSLPSAWRAGGGGTLERSSRHYKHGSHSLAWTWRNGAPLWAIEPAGLREAASTVGGGVGSGDSPDSYEPVFVEPVKQGGIMGWVYNEHPIPGHLTFAFGSLKELGNDTARYRFNLNLDFEGWRAFWVHFEEDAVDPRYAGDAPVTAMMVSPPGGVAEGRVFFDMIRFTPYISWKRSPDPQVPFVNPRIGKSDPEAEAYNWLSPFYWWQKVDAGRGAGLALTQEVKQSFRRTEDRYESWVFGDDLDAEAMPYAVRHEALQRRIDRALEDYERLGIQRRDGAITGQPLFAIRSPYKPSFGLTVFEPIVLYIALDYRLNGNAASLEKFIDLADYVHDQGWAAGSSLGTYDHGALRLSGYFHAVALMRKELVERGLLDREVATMRWYSDFNRIYDRQANDTETSSDKLRTYSLFRLLTLLCMEDSPNKLADMHAFTEWLNKALAIAPGFMDTIKPDYMGYHHRGPFANTYSTDAYHVASLVVYLLHGTPFAVSPTARENLRQALLTQRAISNLYDIPVGVAGRFPHNLSTTHEVLPACVYLALSGDPLDEEVAAAFMRLWRPESDFLQDDLFPRAANGIAYVDTLGALQMMMDLAERGVEPEPAPQGHWTKPSAALAIHRREDWMAAVKGWSQYVWDFEAHRTENVFGRYVSHGALQVYNAGDPITAADSGYRLDRGWDWNRWPGATTIHLPLDELRTDHRVTETYPEGKHRNFSDQTTVGGVNLDNRQGVFAMQLHDTAYEPSFRANKSFFFFDNRIICLGSGIRNDVSDHATETTLFQTYLPNRDAAIVLNGEGVADFPFEQSGRAGESTWIVDPVGNGYVVADGAGLHVVRHDQESKDHRGEQATRGDYAIAWIDHGRAPRGAGYAYAILVNATPGETEAYAADPDHAVLRRDDQAHIVHYEPLGITAYAVFDAQGRIEQGPLVSTNVPSFLMIQPKEDGLTMSFTDPDLRRPRRNNMSLMPIGVLRAPSIEHVARVTIRGRWELAETTERVRVLEIESGDEPGEVFTALEFHAVGGESIQCSLAPIHP